MKNKTISKIVWKVVPSALRIRMTEIICHRRRRKLDGWNNIKFQGSAAQDLIAWLYFKRKKTGFFVDIGAHEGIIMSNTYIFEKIGWKGVAIEPNPSAFTRLRKNRKCACINAAIGGHAQDAADFIVIKGEDMSSGLSDITPMNLRTTEVPELNRTEHISVKVITFDMVMAEYPDERHVDFLSIDTEGYEAVILDSIDFKKYSFGLLTIEANDPDRINVIMQRNGYRLFMEAGCNLMFVPNNIMLIFGNTCRSAAQHSSA